MHALASLPPGLHRRYLLRQPAYLGHMMAAAVYTMPSQPTSASVNRALGPLGLSLLVRGATPRSPAEALVVATDTNTVVGKATGRDTFDAYLNLLAEFGRARAKYTRDVEPE